MPTQPGFVDLFERQVDQTPDAVAAIYKDQQLTYRELDRRANKLARHLAARGVGPDVLVAVAIDRSFEMLVAVLGVLKAGGGYVPLDPGYPDARLAYMLESSRAPIVLTQAAVAGRIPAGDRAQLALDTSWATVDSESDARVARTAGPEHIAYVIYTSGSTGTPKGVAMPRGPLDNLIHWQLGQSKCGAGARTLQFAPLSFDVHFQEIFATLASGGAIVLVDDDLRLDAVKLLHLLEKEKVARLFLPFVALQNLSEIGDAQGLHPSALREIITAGEQLVVTKHLVRFFEKLPQCQLFNHYGPSETHVVTSFTLEGAPSTWPPLPPIGKAIDGCGTHILDEQGNAVAAGETGELFLSGVCLAREYLHRPDLTEARFVTRGGIRMYRTGDLARELPGGDLEFLGRIDGQVKVRGYRIELGEIEVALTSHDAVSNVVVIAREDDPGDKRLVAYVTLSRHVDNLPGELRKHLSDKVPDYMMPSSFVALGEMPRTPSGKIDRRALPRPEQKRPELDTAFVAPRSDMEHALCRLWCKLIKIDKVGVRDNFFDLGGNSLLALQTVARLRQEKGVELPVVKIFEHPTVEALAAFLEEGSTADGAGFRKIEERARRSGTSRAGDVAIVGMAGRFPGASSVDALWKNLCAGVESVTYFAEKELDPSIPQALARDPAYVRARGVVEGAELFDAGFFAINPREAEIMDPQQRIFLELAWEALENAGWAPETFPGPIGVFAGTHNNSYVFQNVATRPELVERLGAFTAMVGNEKDYVATRVAHKMNLTGPALSIHTACSTSLVAIVAAYQSLVTHQCDMALAGGAAITVPQKSGYLYQDGGMLAADGHCRPFDASATGTTFSDGAGIVVLKRLEDAIADGDTVYALIRGAALNNDGSNKVSFTAPSVQGQAEVIAMAQAMADVDPRSITYVEAHGTATPLGDPIEIEGLTRAFRRKTADTGFCGVGSIKSNFGHLTAAAGVAGVVKTALALKNKVIPPTLHYQKANPAIDFDSSPFRVVTRLTAWESPSPRRAGVSSFGVGGTNAHVILEEAPAVDPAPRASRPRQLLTLSARTEAALGQVTARLAAHLEANPDVDLADVAHTLRLGRRAFAHRRSVVVKDRADAVEVLRSGDPRRVSSRVADARAPEVVFMFPGQGAQYVGMGANLYRDEPAFKVVVDQCAEALLPHLGRDLREVLYPPPDKISGAGELLQQTMFTQSALFTIEYALACLWLDWGVKPAAMIGHSVGEFVCAVLAGVMPLEDALRLVAHRGKLIQPLPKGTMLSVRLHPSKLQGRLPASMSVASHNGPELCVVAGPEGDVAKLGAELEKEGVVCKPLFTSHAFHSPMMDPAVAPFEALARTVSFAPPRIPFVSTVTAAWITNEQATDAAYWGRHLRETVRFADAVATLLEDPSRVLLEVGPRTTLATLARQQFKDRNKQIAVSSLGDTPDDDAEWTAILSAAGRLWQAGAGIDWARFGVHEVRRRVPLPTYPFERQRAWVERAERAEQARLVPAVPLETEVAAALANGSAHATQNVAVAASVAEDAPVAPMELDMDDGRKSRLVAELRQIFEEASGIDFATADVGTTFLELGLDSLFLTQVALTLQRKFNQKISFRQLLEDLSTLDLLATHLDASLPREAPAARAPAPSTVSTAPAPAPAVAAPPPAAAYAPAPAAPASMGPAAPANVVQQVIEQQMRLMQQQLELLRASGSAAPAMAAAPPPAPAAARAPAPAPAPAAPPPAPAPAAPDHPHASPYLDGDEPIKPQTYDVKKAFGAIARIHTTNAQELTAKQDKHLEALTKRYTAKTKGSKEWTAANRKTLSDPRVVTGFRPQIKELIYPIVAVRSSGSKIWDIDGNEYVDALNGFGSNFLGHAPKIVTDALKAQIDAGYEIGPMQPMVGDCARLIKDLTGNERSAFCNTGSEAVMGAMRVARTVTGRALIVVFSGSYHGIFDEVIVRGTKKLRSIPAAPGIMPEGVENVLVLDYGTPETLQIIRERAEEFAAVLIEPVQSRRPDFQPKEFLKEVRAITEKSGTCFIFDEVITGFRAHPAGAQAFYDIRADLCTYGKVVGGGMPFGVISGKAQWMDALDGGQWQFGDASIPSVGVTYFAGTFVRHPLAMAAAKATLEYMKQRGPALQEEQNAKTERLAKELNAYFAETGAPCKVKHFSSLWKCVPTEDHPMADLLFCLLRDRGIHIWDGFPCFLTEAHSEADVQRIVTAFKESIDEMHEAGFFPPRKAAPLRGFDSTTPPVAGARLGRDPQGNPAWYVPNPSEPGKYMKVEL